MTKIYSTILLGSGPGDLDLLEAQLYELGDHSPVYKHVIVEGDVTFTGLPKPFYYLEQAERFARWHDRIRYLPIHPLTILPGKQPGDGWAREHSSRMATVAGLIDADPGDIIIHGDADELLTRDALTFIASDLPPGFTPFKLQLSHYSYAIDWQQPWLWPAPSVARWGTFADNFTTLRESPLRIQALPSGRPAGWHLSWLGGPDAIEVKVRSFSHTEVVDLVLGNLDRFYERGEFVGGDPYGTVHDWFEMKAVDIDETWPRWVTDGLCPPSWYRPRTYR